MEILGTNFTLSLGGWRLRFVLALEDVDAQPMPKTPPHRVRVVPVEDEFVR